MQVLQEQKPVLITFSISYRNTLTLRIDITHFKTQPFAKAQPQTINRKIEHLVTELVCRLKQAIGFIKGHDIR